MRRTCLTIAAALAVSLSAFAQDAPPPLAPPMPTIAGGDCGILKQVEMPKVGAQLLYWRCADGREVFFHVRKGWMPDTQSADDAAAVRAELIGLHSRSRADKVDTAMRDAVRKAVTKVRSQTA
jgi:hypothetical protein